MACGQTPQGSGRSLALGHAVCIDTFTGFGGWLTCLDVATGYCWQVDEQGNTRSFG